VELESENDWTDLRHGKIMGFCEQMDEPLGFIKVGNLLTMSNSPSLHHGIIVIKVCCLCVG
jgi:hypothetical protein